MSKTVFYPNCKQNTILPARISSIFFLDCDLRNMEYLRVPLDTKRKSEIYRSRIFKVKYLNVLSE